MIHVKVKEASPSWSGSIDLTWFILPANWACALFVLGGFETFMFVVNWVFLAIGVCGTIVMYVVQRRAKREKLTIHKPKSFYRGLLISIANIFAMNFAGWYYLCMAYTVLVFSHLILRWTYHDENG